MIGAWVFITVFVSITGRCSSAEEHGSEALSYVDFMVADSSRYEMFQNISWNIKRFVSRFVYVFKNWLKFHTHRQSRCITIIEQPISIKPFRIHSVVSGGAEGTIDVVNDLGVEYYNSLIDDLLLQGTLLVSQCFGIQNSLQDVSVYRTAYKMYRCTEQPTILVSKSADLPHSTTTKFRTWFCRISYHYIEWFTAVSNQWLPYPHSQLLFIHLWL